MVAQILRDTLTEDTDTVWVDEPEACGRARDVVKILMPEYSGRVLLHQGREPLFHKYGIWDEGMPGHRPRPRGGATDVEPAGRMPPPA